MVVNADVEYRKGAAVDEPDARQWVVAARCHAFHIAVLAAGSVLLNAVTLPPAVQQRCVWGWLISF